LLNTSTLNLTAAKLRRKYGDKATIGAVDQAPAEVKKNGGLQIIYLQPGHSITPVRFIAALIYVLMWADSRV
jgi:hypothetical protein